ncbi:kelch-like protein 10 isoform X2 [Octopus bimaculoides]|uniref:BTB domain-containing protein n=1 Tax=Octopus bimaculoides TaxID=37653 RepID=A0A0L8H638_OCTBM|nr:kelch-like protein 10 isoform X2 [Octopus bimaculoides]|eukprot:XP_014775180.1 PREDICTED: kelch-like protein 10 [Octopus bimaculoides]
MTSSIKYVKPDKGQDKFRCEIFQLMASKNLCDGEIILVEEQTRFQIHKVILAACSPYFRAIFTCGMKESISGKVVIPGISKDIMANIVKYAYTNEIEVTEENVQVLLCVANRLAISSVQKMCEEFLASRLTVYNCIGIYQFSKFYACTILIRKSWSYILEHFALVSKLSSEFLSLTCNELEEIVRDDCLNVKEEESAFLACQRWIMFEPKIRTSFSKRLFQNLRIGLLHPDILDKLKKNSVTEYKASIYLGQLYKDISLYLHEMPTIFRPRIPSEVIFITGGYGLDGIMSNMETYDARTNQWFILINPAHCLRAYHGTVVLHEQIYILGGYNDNNKYYNGVHRFDIATRQWQELSPMHLSRCYVASTALNGRIYACGGHDGLQRHRAVECYHRSSNQWVLVAPMRYTRSDAGIAPLKGKLYVCGGFDGLTSLNTVEVYCAKTDQWTLLENMSTHRTGLSAVILNANLYILGGFNGQHRLRSVERYNIHEKKWSRVKPMLGRRSNFAATVLEGFIYVIGGYDGQTVISTVECYDPYNRTWSPRADILYPRSAVSATTLKSQEYARYFTFYGQKDNT